MNRKSQRWSLYYESTNDNQSPMVEFFFVCTTMRILHRTDINSPINNTSWQPGQKNPQAWAEEFTNTTKKSSVIKVFESLRPIFARTKAFQKILFSIVVLIEALFDNLEPRRKMSYVSGTLWNLLCLEGNKKLVRSLLEKGSSWSIYYKPNDVCLYRGAPKND